jgi:outer membrane protein assembly factor BamC
VFLENHTVNPLPAAAVHITPLRAAAPLLALTLALTLAGCSSFDNAISGDKVDYRTRAGKTDPLDVPPDLTQLAREGRYQPQSGVVSAAAIKQGGSAAPLAAPAAPTVAASALGDLRVERLGNSRWLVSTLPPETLYPQLRAFWLERGFVLEVDNAQIGVMETVWAENRAKIPMDIIRGTIGKAFDGLYSSGERDRYRTRVERTAGGSEVYISHRGMVEVYADTRHESTIWQPRPTDPELEAEFLARFMVKLGAKEEVARSTVTNAAPAPVKARVATVAATATLEVDDGFDRAWRRVGLALDRSGFTVEDRDRTAGLYFVRYIDPKLAGKEEPNFFMKFFAGEKDVTRAQRYRVLVKAAGAKSLVSVQNSAGNADDSEVARQIIGRLTDELK